MFTNETEKQIKKTCTLHEEPEFAKAGVKATYTVLLNKGIDSLDGFGHGMET